ncbi:sialin-like isoform X2 [Planococcus citri]
MTLIRENEQSRKSTENLEPTKKLLAINHDESVNQPKPVEKYHLWSSKRFLMLVLLFWGYLLTVALKLSINIIVVEMTTRKNITIDNQIIEKAADFDWDSKTIGLVQASTNYGLLFSAFGGYLATKFGGSVTYGIVIALESLLTILSPMFIKWNFYAFIGCCSMVGLFDGFSFASTGEIFSRWVPQQERSTFMSVILCGAYIAVAVSYPVFGNIAYYWGWKMAFFAAGGSTFIWSIIWLIIVRNEPSQDKFISKEEKWYIISETESKHRKEIVHPYWEIITSPAVTAMCIGKMTYSWGYFLISGCLPLYVKDVLQTEVNEVGIISSVPNFACIFMIPLAGAIMDYLQNKTKLKSNQIHKIMMTFGFTSSSILLIVAAFFCNFAISMACFVLVKIILSFNFFILQ